MYALPQFLRSRRRYLTLDPLGAPNFGDAKVVRGLQVQPGTSIAAKIASESHRCIRSDGSPSAHDFIYSWPGDVEGLSQCGCTHAEWNQIVFAKYFAGMYRTHSISKHRVFHCTRDRQ